MEQERREMNQAPSDKYDCFICVVTTHGDRDGKLAAYNTKADFSQGYYTATQVWSKFTAEPNRCPEPNMAGKPKIFIVNVSPSDL